MKILEEAALVLQENNMKKNLLNNFENLFSKYKKEQDSLFLRMNDFELFKANFIERTYYTIQLVIKALEVTLEAPHLAKMILDNLKEESGFGFKGSHFDLLIKCFGKGNENLITKETKAFVDMRKKLFKSNNKNEVIGNFLASERAANGMLLNIKNTFKDNFTGMLYFDVHLDGTEERHFSDGWNLTELVDNEEEMLLSAKNLFDVQLDFFRALTKNSFMGLGA